MHSRRFAVVAPVAATLLSTACASILGIDDVHVDDAGILQDSSLPATDAATDAVTSNDSAPDGSFCAQHANAFLCIDFDEDASVGFAKNESFTLPDPTITGDASVFRTDAPGLDGKDTTGLTTLTPAIDVDGGEATALIRAVPKAFDATSTITCEIDIFRDDAGTPEAGTISWSRFDFEGLAADSGARTLSVFFRTVASGDVIALTTSENESSVTTPMLLPFGQWTHLTIELDRADAGGWQQSARYSTSTAGPFTFGPNPPVEPFAIAIRGLSVDVGPTTSGIGTSSTHATFDNVVCTGE